MLPAPAFNLISLCKKTPYTALLSSWKQTFTKVNLLIFKTSKALSMTFSWERLPKQVVFGLIVESYASAGGPRSNTAWLMKVETWSGRYWAQYPSNCISSRIEACVLASLNEERLCAHSQHFSWSTWMCCSFLAWQTNSSWRWNAFTTVGSKKATNKTRDMLFRNFRAIGRIYKPIFYSTTTFLKYSFGKVDLLICNCGMWALKEPSPFTLCSLRLVIWKCKV